MPDKFAYYTVFKADKAAASPRGSDKPKKDEFCVIIERGKDNMLAEACKFLMFSSEDVAMDVAAKLKNKDLVIADAESMSECRGACGTFYRSVRSSEPSKAMSDDGRTVGVLVRQTNI